MKKRDGAGKNAIITGIIGGILVPVATGLLIWEHKTEQSTIKVAVNPATGAANGFQLVLDF
jgi:hypothetical protein